MASQSPQLAGARDSSRDAIVLAAISVFARKGFEGATIREISGIAGLNVSLISYYFGGKAGLFEFCLQTFGEGKAVLVESILTSPKSPEEVRIKMQIVFEQLVQGHLENPDMTALIHRELASGMATSREIFGRVYSRIFHTFKDFICSAHAQGYLRSDIDPFVCAQIMWLGFVTFLRDDAVNLALNGKTLADPDYRKNLIEQAVELFLRGSQNVGEGK